MLSTILYNTASVIHEKNFPLFGKTTSGVLGTNQVNDYCIFGFIFLTFAMVFHFCKMALPGIAYTTRLDEDPPLSAIHLARPYVLLHVREVWKEHLCLYAHGCVWGSCTALPSPRRRSVIPPRQLRSTREEADAFVHDVMYKSDDFAESVVKRYTQAAAGEAEDAEAEAAERIARISASVGDGGETTALLASLALSNSGGARRHSSFKRIGPLQTAQ